MTKMLRARAPLRISFGGGGSDVEPYATRHGGLVFSTTIDRYAYCTIGDFTHGDFEERLKQGVHEELGLPGRQYGISISSDVPPGSGLGSSSSLVVAVVRAVADYWEMPLSKYELAEVAFRVERDFLHIKGGRQDQYAAAFGGFNLIEFEKTATVIPVNFDSAELRSCLVLVDTRLYRVSSNILQRQMDRFEKEGINEAVEKMKDIALEMKQALLAGEIGRLGPLLTEEWEQKKKLDDAITSPWIDSVFEGARKAGASGGKLLGAGGGGHLLFFVEPEKRPSVISFLKGIGLEQTIFNFESEGAKSWKA